MWKTKWKPFKIMRAIDKFTTAMSYLGECEVTDRDLAATVVEYLRVVYGVNNITNLDQVRHHLFQKLYAPKDKTDPLRKIKSCWPLRLTTTQMGTWAKAEENQLCCICLARKSNPVEFGSAGHGWEISPDKLTTEWYTGEMCQKCLPIGDEDLREITYHESESRSQCSSYEEQDLEGFE